MPTLRRPTPRSDATVMTSNAGIYSLALIYLGLTAVGISALFFGVRPALPSLTHLADHRTYLLYSGLLLIGGALGLASLGVTDWRKGVLIERPALWILGVAMTVYSGAIIVSYGWAVLSLSPVTTLIVLGTLLCRLWSVTRAINRGGNGAIIVPRTAAPTIIKSK